MVLCMHWGAADTGYVSHALLSILKENIRRDRYCMAYLSMSQCLGSSSGLSAGRTCCAGAGALHAPAMATTVLTGPQGDDSAGTLLHGGSAAVTDENGAAWVASQW